MDSSKKRENHQRMLRASGVNVCNISSIHTVLKGLIRHSSAKIEFQNEILRGLRHLTPYQGDMWHLWMKIT